MRKRICGLSCLISAVVSIIEIASALEMSTKKSSGNGLSFRNPKRKYDKNIFENHGVYLCGLFAFRRKRESGFGWWMG